MNYWARMCSVQEIKKTIIKITCKWELIPYTMNKSDIYISEKGKNASNVTINPATSENQDEADELEDQIDALYEKEADDLEKEIDDKLNEEFDQIESETNQLTNGNN